MKKQFFGWGCMLFIFLMGCTTSTQTQYTQAELGKEFQLSAGQTAEIQAEDLYVQFVEITENSLCPEDVLCVWAGQATAKLKVWKTGQPPEDVNLTLPDMDTASKMVRGYKITFIDLLPHKKSTVQVELKDYAVKLKVERGN